MKKVLILTSVTKKGEKAKIFESFKKKLNIALKNDAIQIEAAALKELAYLIGSKTKIWHPEHGYDLADFDAVIISSVSKYKQLGITVAHYLSSKKIPFTDKYLLTNDGSKLVSAIIESNNNLPIPNTFYAPLDCLKEYIKESHSALTYPLILKSDAGRKGRDNYLIHNEKELIRAYKKNPNVLMLAQRFIPNDGDYRLLVLGKKVSLCIMRKGSNDTHLSNTSQGGKATIVPVKSLNKKILQDAKQATRIENLQVAGVDIIIDKNTQKHYILEVNRAPQIYSGSFVNKKTKVYADFIKKLTTARRNTEKTILGRATTIDLPSLKIFKLPAKIDTGADMSSIWATATKNKKSGNLEVVFLGPESKFYNGKKITFKKGQFLYHRVSNSFGELEKRYSIKLSVEVQGKKIRGTFNLTPNRSKKIYPVLIGCRLLRKKFLIDPSKGSPLMSKKLINSDLAKSMSPQEVVHYLLERDGEH